MKIFTIHSTQHALFFKNFINQNNFFTCAEQIKSFLTVAYPTKKFEVDFPRINLSNILFRILSEEISIQVSLDRCDLFWQNKNFTSAEINYAQVLDRIREILSKLFTFFETKQQIVRVGTIVNYFLHAEDKSATDILGELLSDVVTKNSFNITRLETKNTFNLDKFLTNDLKQVWDGVYPDEQGKKIPFVGLARDINIVPQTTPLSIENYNSFLSETASRFTKESILRWGK